MVVCIAILLLRRNILGLRVIAHTAQCKQNFEQYEAIDLLSFVYKEGTDLYTGMHVQNTY